MSDKNRNVGQGLKQIRTEMGMNQKNFAALLGISKSFVSEIQAGNKYPNLDLLTTLALKHNINTRNHPLHLANSVNFPYHRELPDLRS